MGILAICGGLAWKVNSRIQMNRLDREVRNLGSANLDRTFGPDHWERFDRALRFVAGEDKDRYLVLVFDERGEEVYRSAQWPPDLDASTLPSPGAIDPLATPELDPVNRLHRAPPRPGALSPDNPPLPRLEPAFVTRSAGGMTWRFGIMGNPLATLILGVNLRELETGMSELRNSYLVWLPLAILLVSGGSWVLAGRALRPVRLLSEAVEAIDVRRLHGRLRNGGNDREFQRLIDVFNDMLERLELSFQQASRFSADAAHELRTPITVLLGELEQSLQHADAGSVEQQKQAGLLEEVEHLKAIIERLLLLSQADAGKLPIEAQQVDLSEMVDEVAADAEILANGRISIESKVTSGLALQGDRVLLHQLLQNLASNALRYNYDQGKIRFELFPRDGYIVLEVANTGPGIPLEDREKVFLRFHRADPARFRRDGTGLGLALSREIARAHGGDLKLLTSATELTVFELTLPGPIIGKTGPS
jgi:signal transduction histidine kinase